MFLGLFILGICSKPSFISVSSYTFHLYPVSHLAHVITSPLFYHPPPFFILTANPQPSKAGQEARLSIPQSFQCFFQEQERMGLRIPLLLTFSLTVQYSQSHINLLYVISEFKQYVNGALLWVPGSKSSISRSSSVLFSSSIVKNATSVQAGKGSKIRKHWIVQYLLAL